MAITGMGIAAANAAINWARNATPASPSSLEVALCTTAPSDNAGTGAVEVGTGLGYARSAITLGAPTDGVATNTNTLDFGTSTGAIGNVPHLIVYTNTGGIVAHGPFTVQSATFNWGSGVHLTVAAGQLSVDFNELITV